MNHTPGPWIVVENVNDIFIDSPIESNGGDESIEVCRMSRQDEDPYITPNARLIAAAPELLEALKRLLGAIEADVKISPTMPVKISFETNGMAIDEARAAIAKAEGGTP
jgi:hypothetical protein